MEDGRVTDAKVGIEPVGSEIDQGQSLLDRLIAGSRDICRLRARCGLQPDP